MAETVYLRSVKGRTAVFTVVKYVWPVLGQFEVQVHDSMSWTMGYYKYQSTYGLETLDSRFESCK